MTEMNSRKITYLNYMLITLIVLLHCDNRFTADYNFVVTGGGTAVIDCIYNLLEKVCTTAVPTFYALSGYLFYRNCTDENILGKVKKRFRIVLIPYLFWNIIFYSCYFLMNEIPFIAGRINMNVPRLSVASIIFENNTNPPLWFLRKLFYLQLLSPIVYWMFKKLKKKMAVALAAIALLDIFLQFGYSNTIHWVPVFFGAGFVAMFYRDKVELELQLWKINSKWKKVGLVIALFIIQATIGRIQWITAPLFWWALLSCMSIVPYKTFMKGSFFVFCTHYFTILLVRKAFLIILGNSPIMMITTYLLTFVVVLVGMTIIGELFKKVLPNTYVLVCGGR